MSAQTDSVQIVEKQPFHNAKTGNLFEIMRDWVGLFVTLTGIFSVLLYIAGRSFAAGYFAAMNIPSYQVSFSIWEYGEVGWLPMVLYPLIMFAAAGLSWGILHFLLAWLSTLFVRLMNWLKQRNISPKFKLPAWIANTINWIRKILKSIWSAIKPPPLSLYAKIAFVFPVLSFIALLILLFAGYTLEYIYNIGRDNGRKMVLENSPQIELISSSIIPLESTNTIAPQLTKDGIYIYQGFHLLTSNNGKYYLFNEIDKETCKPTKVYIIDSGQNIQVNLLPPVSLADQCSKP